MPRHHPSLVHLQLSAQLRAGFLKQPPPAYAALMNHPPSPIPPLATASDRTAFDSGAIGPGSQAGRGGLGRRRRRQPAVQPLPIRYELRDRLRRRLFRDHPMEAYRAKSVVEHREDLDLAERESVRRLRSDGMVDYGTFDRTQWVSLDRWTALSQRTFLPTAEDCVDFALNLKKNNANLTINLAYWISISQFRTLRFEEEIKRSFARQEAEYFFEQPSLEHDQEKASSSWQEQGRWSRDLLKRQDELIKDNLKKTSFLNHKNLKQAPNQQQQQQGEGNSSAKRRENAFGLLATGDGGADLTSSKRRESDARFKFNEGLSVLEEIKRKSKRLTSL